MKKILSHIKLLFFFKLILLTFSSDITTRVMLNIYSGRNNPTIELTKSQMNELQTLVTENTFILGNSDRIFGYFGFYFPRLGLHLQGYPGAELYLLDLFKEQINEEQYEEILDIINLEYKEDLSKQVGFLSFDELRKRFISDPQCEKTPIRGPDHYPAFDPYSNANGCFIDRQSDNNCYNYATNVLTNTFAQPGRSKDIKVFPYTCEKIIAAAAEEADGLIYLGRTIGKKLSEGHYIASVIHPYDHHWIRMDEDRTWSHKGGANKIVNFDANGDTIVDPSIQRFGPWRGFCGYFHVVASKISIK
jgi:hypothetical protein